MSLFDRFRKRAEQTAEVAKATFDTPDYIPNRGDRRHHRNSLKKKGAGYTRALRKGRTQRWP